LTVFPVRLDGSRVVDEAECVASVLLAILLAHMIGASNISWAAFSGYMVMRGHVAESFLRGVLRIVGTAAGALLGLGITPLVVGNMALTSIALALVGLTFVMILLDKTQHPQIAIADFARTRMLEVVAGTAACVIVSTLSTVSLRRIWPAERTVPAARVGWHPHAARHAGQAAVALLLLPALGLWLHLPALAQSAVAIMAVMLVPVSSIGASGFRPVSRRLINRVLGCLAGAALAAMFLFLGHGSAPILIAGTILGVAVGRHLENGKGALAYAGTQFVLAVLVTLVPDDYAAAHIGPAIDRLAGTLIGMALLEPVLLLWHLTAPGEGRVTVPAEEEAGGV
jgi:uncharacterized membrane protein YccC